MTKPFTRTPQLVDEHVGARMRLRRKLLGLTQQELAEALGLTFQQIQKYERGKNRVSASKLYESARALRVGITYFFEGLEDEGGCEVRPEELALGQFLQTSEGLELARLFPRIEQRPVRRQVLELLRVLAEEEPA